MQINSISNQNNRSNTSFTGIKSIQYRGLYKKAPELSKDLVEAFKQNPKAMDFCKKYDVDIVFYAVKETVDFIKSSIHIFYENPTNSKFRKFINMLNGKKDSISTLGWGKYELEKSTQDLKEAILPEGFEKGKGLLSSHIQHAEEQIQEALDKKNAKIAKKQAQKVAKLEQNNRNTQNMKALDQATKELIDSTK